MSSVLHPMSPCSHPLREKNKNRTVLAARFFIFLSVAWLNLVFYAIPLFYYIHTQIHPDIYRILIRTIDTIIERLVNQVHDIVAVFAVKYLNSDVTGSPATFIRYILGQVIRIYYILIWYVQNHV